MKTARILAILVLALFLFSVISPANALWVGGNIDVHNNSGQVAHDFHIKGQIKSTTPPTLLIQIGYVDIGVVFPNFTHTITHAGGDLWGFEAEWSSLDVQPSEEGHFGLFFDATCRNVWVDLDGWWTDINGDRIGPWPILGFEVPTHWWDPPKEQVFRLQGDAGEMGIDTEIIAMDLMYAPPENAEQLFALLNADHSDQLGEWISVPEDKLPGPYFPAESFFDVFVEIDLDMGGIQPNQLLLVRTLVAWPDEPAGRWFFHVHQAHSENTPPVADAGDDQTVEQDSLDGASVTLDGSGSYDPEGAPLTYLWTWDGESATGVNPTIILPLGTTTVTLVVNDGIMDSAPDTVDITVQDTTPPKIALDEPEPSELWPPNHKFVDVTITGVALDICDADLAIDVSINVIDAEGGDGGPTHDPDHEILAVGIEEEGEISILVALRAERSGHGEGRIYEITVIVTDDSGNAATDTVEVIVPHDQGKGKK